MLYLDTVCADIQHSIFKYLTFQDKNTISFVSSRLFELNPIDYSIYPFDRLEWKLLFDRWMSVIGRRKRYRSKRTSANHSWIVRRQTRSEILIF